MHGSRLTWCMVLFLILHEAAPEAFATADACAVVLKTPDSFLNLRKGPGAKFPIIAKLQPGDRIHIDSGLCEEIAGQSVCSDGSWTRVRELKQTTEGPKLDVLGWVATKFIKVSDDDCSAKPASLQDKHPFVGRWHWDGPETCVKDYDSGNVAIEITNSQVVMYETRCDIRSMQKLTDKSYRFRLTCQGEGELSNGDHVVSMLPRSKLNDDLLLLVSLQDGMVHALRPCLK